MVKTANLNELFDFHQGQCTECWNQFFLYKDLVDLITKDDYKYVELNYRVFWSIAIKATMMSSINILTKLYDHQKNAVSLKKLLQLIKSNKSEFTPDKFRQRYPEKNIYPHLAPLCVYPGDAELDKDLKLLSEKDDCVNYLTKWRNNFYSHYSAEIIINSVEFAKKYPVDNLLIENLINRAGATLNKYQALYSRNTHSRKLVGFGDHLHLIQKLKNEYDEFYAK